MATKVYGWMGRRIATFMVLLVCVWGLAACQLRVSRTTATASNQLVLSTLQDVKTFNYALNQEFPNVFLFTTEGLTLENGKTGAVEPALAESWEIGADQKRIIFTLRPNLRWSDGQPLTAADVVFTFNDIVFNPEIPTEHKETLRFGPDRRFPIVRKLDDRRVEFSFPEPFAPFLRLVSGPPDNLAILPKHALEKAVHTKGRDGNPLFISTWNTGTDPRQVVGNGPFRMRQYVPGERMIFERNPYYWGQDATGRSLPKIERLIWQIVESTDTQLLKFRSGDLDVMGDVRPLRPEYYALLKHEETRGKFKLYNGGPWSGTTYLAFNLTTAQDAQGRPFVDPIKSRWFNTLAFRQAIAHAINRPRMSNNIYRGIGHLQNSPISVQSPYYLPPEQGLKVYDYDLDKARQLLLSAGFQYNAQGKLLDWNQHPVRFTLLTNAGNKLREALGAQIKDDLSQIGIQVDFTPITFGALLEKVSNTRDWDAHMIGFSGGIEPHAGANLWLSTGGSHTFNLAPQPGQQPIQNWQPKDWELEIDRLLAAGARELDESKRKAIYAQFQRVVQEQVPVIHLVHEIALMAVRDRIQGLQYTGLPTWGLWNLRELRIEEKKAS